MKLNTKKKNESEILQIEREKIFPLFKSKKIEIKKNN